MHLTRTLLGAALGLALLAGCTTEPKTPPPQFTELQPNASVYLHDVDVRSWGKDNSILLETYHHEWYRAVLLGGCTNAGVLTDGIGFETRTGDMVDRGSVAIVGRQRCSLASFSKIAEPPPGSRW
ncbi:MAG: hypothetical protein ABUL73_01975 [Alphaproteobacteria bacterium]